MSQGIGLPQSRPAVLQRVARAMGGWNTVCCHAVEALCMASRTKAARPSSNGRELFGPANGDATAEPLSLRADIGIWTVSVLIVATVSPARPAERERPQGRLGGHGETHRLSLLKAFTRRAENPSTECEPGSGRTGVRFL